ncbi:phage portal protein [Bacillus inaquosorum]|uniref:phage portal protein n=1 Tax=Bacillus inaquosorum TaxID=483913 RepID=UPI0022821B42|nr:phage portal protein [Bacillus inaquosorum]MCY7974749.1 phage portal protein [Bacillus inaquosorum]MCY8138742.1 phage portal protein [Bacillus inaquosorum]MCY8273550.1 phage portal protein [Bacillus inaquosorum]MCY8727415.1 phage portal protein [Bacillus inaquosorum]MCY9058540.1 phage portal protein [Bacillus inaquosorum]
MKVMAKKQAKKSPAPWHAVPCGDTKPIYIYSAYSEEEKERFPYSNGRLIAAVFDLSSYSQKSNAALMAAAPELLEASKAALDFLKGNSIHSKERIIQVLEKAKKSAESEREEKKHDQS